MHQMHFILDAAAGEPVHEPDLLTWARWFETHSLDRVLKTTELFPPDGRSRVSTVFLGLNHNYWGGPPILWETMVFGGPLDLETDRYSSRAEALAGHAEMVARVIRASLKLIPLP